MWRCGSVVIFKDCVLHQHHSCSPWDKAIVSKLNPHEQKGQNKNIISFGINLTGLWLSLTQKGGRGGPPTTRECHNEPLTTRRIELKTSKKLVNLRRERLVVGPSSVSCSRSHYCVSLICHWLVRFSLGGLGSMRKLN